jgi:hypothetical protein
MRGSSKLDRLQVAAPCPVSWEQMSGDRRIRFCEHCKLNVYNIAELSKAEAESLINTTEGRLCARLYRRMDGTVITKDCPVGLRALRLRVSKKVAAAFAAIVSLASLVVGQQPSTKKKSCPSQTLVTVTYLPGDQTAAKMTGTVWDIGGATVAGAEVELVDLENKECFTARSDDEGRFKLNSVRPGKYQLRIHQVGYGPYVSQLVVETNRIIEIEALLQPGSLMGEVVVLEEKPRFDIKPGTTIINTPMIQRLPLP